MWRKPQLWLGLVISGVALWLAFRGIDWPAAAASLRDAQYIYLIPAAAALLLAMAVRAERWRWLYGDRRRLPFARAFGPLCIGYFVSNTFPLRLGEVARTLFVTRDRRVTIAHTASTIVVEHVLDVLVVLGLLLGLLAARLVPLPDWAAQGAALSAVLFGGALVVMLIAVWQRRRVERWAEAALDRIPRLHTASWVRRLGQVLDGFAVLRPGAPLIVIIGLSVAAWLISAVTFQLALRAFVPDPQFIVSLFVTIITTFALLLPASPGSLGVMQGAIVLSLGLFGLPQAQAFSFAIVFHVMEIIVMDAAGLVALWREAGSWASMKSQLRSVTSAAEKPLAADDPSAAESPSA
jgi:uncharacterized protein (TIRG00374 family)